MIDEKATIVDVFEGSHSGEKQFFKLCLDAKEKFVITKAFRDVVCKINSGDKMIAIGGPKGVGKSMALAAIAALSRKTRPCLLCSPSGMHIDVYHLYVQEVYKQFGK